MVSLKNCDNREVWDGYVIEQGGHPLQLWGWGATKTSHGWSVERLIASDIDGRTIGAAQILIRRLPWPFKSIAYIPRGPVVDSGREGELLKALENHVRSQYRSVAISIEPDWTELPKLPKGWRRADNTILIANTLILDLEKTEDELLSAMNKKTRQYIRKSAAEEGLVVQQVKGKDYLDSCLGIYKQTAKRAGFALHKDDYYHDVFDNLGDASPVFAAFYNGQPVAFVWLAISASTAFELYGGMNDKGQELRANYALKWHAIRKMREWGVERYDMNGLVSDGVSNFKRGFADHEDQLVGTYDKPLSALYFMYSKVLPLGKKVVRAMKRK